MDSNLALRRKRLTGTLEQGCGPAVITGRRHVPKPYLNGDKAAECETACAQAAGGLGEPERGR